MIYVLESMSFSIPSPLSSVKNINNLMQQIPENIHQRLEIKESPPY